MSKQGSQERGDRPLLVGIAGGSASGKTSLARLLQQIAKTDSVSLLELDRFYRPRPQPAALGRVNFDCPQAVDLELAEQVVVELIGRGRALAPVYNFATHQREGFQRIASAPIVIIEGLFAFSHRPLRQLLDLKIFVDTPSGERMARRIRRDCQRRGRDIESVKKQWAESVLPMHQRFVEPMRVHADRIIDGREDLKRVARTLFGEWPFAAAGRERNSAGLVNMFPQAYPAD